MVSVKSAALLTELAGPASMADTTGMYASDAMDAVSTNDADANATDANAADVATTSRLSG